MRVDAPSDSRSRVAWVDGARGLGIVLVVVGHVLRGLVSGGILEPAAGVRFADAWIYAFHMPLFFALSGLFVDRSARRPLGRFTAERLRTLAWPYLVWTLLQGSVQAALSGVTNSQAAFADLWRVVYDPPMQFWFLYVLLILLLAYAGLRALRATPWGIVALAGVLLALREAAWLGPWGVLHQVARHAGFFGLGAVAGARDGVSRAAGAPRGAAALAAALGFAGVAAVIALGDGTGPASYAGFFATAWLGTGAACGVAIALGGSAAGRGLAWLGRRSLEIYVAHTLASAGVRIALASGLGLRDPGIHLVAGTLAGLVLPVVLLALTERAGFPWLFRLPARGGR